VLNEIDDFAANWSQQFELSLENLEESVEKQAASYSYYATRAAKAKAELELAKHRVRVKEAELYLQYSRSPSGYNKDGSIKLPSIEATKSMVASDKTLHALQEGVIELKQKSDIYMADTEASAQKGQMLQLLSFNLKRELSFKEGL